MKASVIITTYKRSSFLMKAIDSCLNQVFEGEMQIIIVDDNGKGTAYQTQNEKNLSVLINNNKIDYIALKENQGACSARNIGANKASGEYLFFLDDDDEFLPDKIKKQVQYLEHNPSYAANVCAFKKKRFGKDFPASDSQPIIGDLKNFIKYGNFYTPMLCIKKIAFEAIGGFQETPRYQDIYFMYHLLSEGFKIHTCKEPLYMLNEHKQERITNKTISNTLIAVDNLRSFTLKHKILFDKEEWQSVESKLNSLTGYAYYSSNYVNRLKSIPFWVKCYKLSYNDKYILMIVKCFFPNSCIKTLEQLKKKHA